MRFETILNEQSEKIRQLEERLALSHDSTAQAMRLIAHLKQQIETKNGEIARLRAELGRKMPISGNCADRLPLRTRG